MMTFSVVLDLILAAYHATMVISFCVAGDKPSWLIALFGFLAGYFLMLALADSLAAASNRNRQATDDLIQTQKELIDDLLVDLRQRSGYTRTITVRQSEAEH